MDVVKYFPAIVKTAGNDVLVWGKATDSTLDTDRQVCDPAWSAKAMKKWFDTGANVRVAHNGGRPAGIGVDLVTDDDGATWVKSRVVDQNAKELVLARVLTAYSVGIHNAKLVRDVKAAGGRIAGGEIMEISLVDRPANPSCGIQLVKSANGFSGVEFGFSYDNARLAELARKAAYDPVSAVLWDRLPKADRKAARQLSKGYNVKAAKPMTPRDALRMELRRSLISYDPSVRMAAESALAQMDAEDALGTIGRGR